jgi:hypothetical protein
MSNFENKKLLVHPSQAESTGCKEVVRSCCFSYGRNKKARKVWVPKASQNFKSKDDVHTSFIRTCQSSKPSKVVIKRKNMVWVPKVGQTIKPNDDVQTSSIATTCYTSVARKGVGKNKKMMWVRKGCAHDEVRVDVQTSTIRTTHIAKLSDYKDKKTSQYGIDWTQGSTQQ